MRGNIFLTRKRGCESLPPEIISVTAKMTSAIPMASRTVMVSLNSKTAIATAVTGSTAPRIATGVLPIFWMAALVHISEKAVGNKAMPKAEGQSIQLLFSVWIQSGSKLNANRNRPNTMT